MDRIALVVLFIVLGAFAYYVWNTEGPQPQPRRVVNVPYPTPEQIIVIREEQRIVTPVAKPVEVTPPVQVAPQPVPAPVEQSTVLNHRPERRWDAIIIHHSASSGGSAASFDRHHKARGWRGLGYHFVIGNGKGAKDGELEEGFRWREGSNGAHLKQNNATIGICLVGDFSTTGRPTAAQLATLKSLIRSLREQYGDLPITGHGQYPGAQTACPGNLDLTGIRSTHTGRVGS